MLNSIQTYAFNFFFGRPWTGEEKIFLLVVVLFFFVLNHFFQDLIEQSKPESKKEEPLSGKVEQTTRKNENPVQNVSNLQQTTTNYLDSALSSHFSQNQSVTSLPYQLKKIEKVSNLQTLTPQSPSSQFLLLSFTLKDDSIVNSNVENTEKNFEDKLKEESNKHELDLSKFHIRFESPSIERAFVPIHFEDKQSFDILIQLSESGNFSKTIETMKYGDVIEARKLETKCTYKHGENPNLGLIGGGSGIIPILKIIYFILHDPNDTTHISLLYSLVKEDEEANLFKQQLESLTIDFGNRLKIKYITEVLTEEVVIQTMPSRDRDPLIIFSGPSVMIDVTKRLLSSYSNVRYI